MNDSQFSGKKEQFVKPGSGSLRIVCGITAAAVLMAVTLYFTLFYPTGRGEGQEGSYFGLPVTGARSYVGRQVAMTAIEPVIEDGKIILPLSLVSEKNIVSFEVENNEGMPVPLMAYITPSGRLFVGSSMCEPCRGRYFSLAGETLVCDTCRTTYTIEDHRFLAGSTACGSYPPVYLNPVVENGMISILLSDVLEWRPRVY